MFIVLQIFFLPHANFRKLGNITRIFPSFTRDAFRPIACELKYLIDVKY